MYTRKPYVDLVIGGIHISALGGITQMHQYSRPFLEEIEAVFSKPKTKKNIQVLFRNNQVLQRSEIIYPL